MRWLDVSTQWQSIYRLDIKDDNIRLVMSRNTQEKEPFVVELMVYEDGEWRILDNTHVSPDRPMAEIQNMAYENAKQVMERHAKQYAAWLTALRKT